MRWVLVALVVTVHIASAQAAGPNCGQLDAKAQETGPFRPPLGAVVNGTGRLSFHSAPDAQCKRADFLVPGDHVVVYVPYKHWLYVSFVNEKNGSQTEGWLPDARLKITGTMGLSN